ncbi:hypothetical protein X975_18851, partial [Stegodyphus mimosarum]
VSLSDADTPRRYLIISASSQLLRRILLTLVDSLYVSGIQSVEGTKDVTSFQNSKFSTDCRLE